MPSIYLYPLCLIDKASAELDQALRIRDVKLSSSTELFFRTYISIFTLYQVPDVHHHLSMISSRAFLFCFLSIACVGTFLYYTLLPQGPHLLRWKQPSTEELEPLVLEPETQDETVSEPEIKLRPETEDVEATNPASTVSEVSKADKFTPEYDPLYIRLSDP